MKTHLYKTTALLGAGLLIISGGSAANLPQDGRQLQTKSGYELIGSRNQSPEKGRKAPSLNVTPAKAKAKATTTSRAGEETVLVDEDFSLWTEGSIEEPVYTADIADFWVDPDYMWNIAPSRTKQPGWAGQALHCADGVCGLCYPDYGGFIQTPRGDYSGTVTISFRVLVSDMAKCEKYKINVGLLKGDWENGSFVAMDSYDYLPVEIDGQWHEVSFTYDNAYGGTDAFFQINSYDEAFIDDVKVTTKTGFLPHPEAKAATNFTDDGFTANWGDVGKATDYLLTCWRNIATGTEETSLTESFEGVNTTSDGYVDEANPNYPEGWEVDAAGGRIGVATGDEAYDGNKAIVLNASDQWIGSPSTGSLITSATIDARFLSGAIRYVDPETNEVLAEAYPGSFYVEGWNGHKWCYTGNSFHFSEDKEYHHWNLTEIVAGKYYRVRLVATNLEGDGEPVRVAFDNFKVTTLPASEKEYIVNQLPVEGTSYVFRGLDPASDYYYCVEARNTELGISSGEPETDVFAFGLAPIHISDPSDVDRRGGYTANWEVAPKAEEYQVENIRIYTAPADEENATILSETFAALSGVTNTPADPVVFNNATLMSLDEYCDNHGWVGYLCGLAKGAIGGIGVVEYGIGGQIQTPFLSLGHDGGKYTVTITTCGTTGDYLYVVNSSGEGGAIPLSENYETYTAEFTGGTNFDFLAFYTAYKTPFFISGIEVNQNLKAGDQVMNILEEQNTEANSYRFSGLDLTDPNVTYGYDVYGIHRFLSNTAWSPRSEVKQVSFPSALDRVEAEGIEVVAGQGTIGVTAPESTCVDIYSVSGIRMAGFNGSRTVSLPTGVYVVKAGESSVKAVVR